MSEGKSTMELRREITLQWLWAFSRNAQLHECPSREGKCQVNQDCFVLYFPVCHVWLFVTPWTVACFRPWNSPGKSTGVGSHCFLQVIFPTQGLNPGLLHCRQILYHLSHHGGLSSTMLLYKHFPHVNNFTFCLWKMYISCPPVLRKTYPSSSFNVTYASHLLQ